MVRFTIVKKKIKVCCLIIICQHKVLILRRNHLGPRNKLWEFPGGKQENGEDELTCIKREVMEEINLKISSAEFFDYIEKEYEDIYIELASYISHVKEIPKINLTVHDDFKWIDPVEFKNYEYPEANKSLLKRLYINYQIFPKILDSIKINYDSIYGYDLPLIHSSINKLEKYLDTYNFDFLIHAIELKPEIYFDDAIDINRVFLKISPNYKIPNYEEKLYIEKHLISPSSVVWTCYQNIVKIIQSDLKNYNIDEVKNMKLKIEKALFSKTKRKISKNDFKRFMGSSI